MFPLYCLCCLSPSLWQPCWGATVLPTHKPLTFAHCGPSKWEGGPHFKANPFLVQWQVTSLIQSPSCPNIHSAQWVHHLWTAHIIQLLTNSSRLTHEEEGKWGAEWEVTAEEEGGGGNKLAVWVERELTATTTTFWGGLSTSSSFPWNGGSHSV